MQETATRLYEMYRPLFLSTMKSLRRWNASTVKAVLFLSNQNKFLSSESHIPKWHSNIQSKII